MAITLMDIAQRSQSTLIQGIVKTVIERSPFLSLVPFRTVPSKRLSLSRESELPAGSFRAGSTAYTDGKAIANRTDIHLKLFGGSFTIDATDIEIPTFDGNSELAYQINALSRGLALDMKKEMINADEAIDPKSFTGIKAWQKYFAGQGITNRYDLATNGATIATAGAQTLINRINDAINANITIPTIGITNRTVISHMEALTVASAQNNVFAQYFKPEIITLNGVRVQGGSWKGIPIIAIDEDSQGAEILDFNETTGSSDVTSSIYFISMGQGLAMGLNQFAEGMRVRRIELDSGVKISIDWPAGFACEHPKAITRLGGILAV